MADEPKNFLRKERVKTMKKDIDLVQGGVVKEVAGQEPPTDDLKNELTEKQRLEDERVFRMKKEEEVRVKMRAERIMRQTEEKQRKEVEKREMEARQRQEAEQGQEAERKETEARQREEAEKREEELKKQREVQMQGQTEEQGGQKQEEDQRLAAESAQRRAEEERQKTEVDRQKAEAEQQAQAILEQARIREEAQREEQENIIRQHAEENKRRMLEEQARRKQEQVRQQEEAKKKQRDELEKKKQEEAERKKKIEEARRMEIQRVAEARRKEQQLEEQEKLTDPQYKRRLLLQEASGFLNERNKLERDFKNLEKNRKPLDTRKSSLLREIRDINSAFQNIALREEKIEKEEDLLEEKEGSATAPHEKRRIEKERWALESRRQQLEKQRWPWDEKLSQLNEQIKSVDTAYQKITDQQDTIRQQQEQILTKEEAIRLEAEKIEIAAKRQKLEELKKTLVSERTALSDRLSNINSSIEGVANREKDVEIEKRSIEQQERAATDSKERTRLEKERWQIDGDRRKIESERWGLEKEKQQIENQLKKVESKFQALLDTDTKLLFRAKEIDRVFGLAPKEAAEPMKQTVEIRTPPDFIKRDFAPKTDQFSQYGVEQQGKPDILNTPKTPKYQPKPQPAPKTFEIKPRPMGQATGKPEPKKQIPFQAPKSPAVKPVAPIVPPITPSSLPPPPSSVSNIVNVQVSGPRDDQPDIVRGRNETMEAKIEQLAVAEKIREQRDEQKKLEEARKRIESLQKTVAEKKRFVERTSSGKIPVPEMPKKTAASKENPASAAAPKAIEQPEPVSRKVFQDEMVEPSSKKVFTQAPGIKPLEPWHPEPTPKTEIPVTNNAAARFLERFRRVKKEVKSPEFKSSSAAKPEKPSFAPLPSDYHKELPAGSPPQEVIRPLPQKPSFREKLWVRFLVASFLLVLLAGVATFWYWYLVIRVRPPTTAGCQANEDCQAGYLCSNEGVCTEISIKECDQNSDCPENYVCAETGKCISKTAEVTPPPPLLPVESTRILSISAPEQLQPLLAQVVVEPQDNNQIKYLAIKDTGENKILNLRDFIDVLQIRSPLELYQKVRETDFTLFLYSQQEGNRLGLVARMKTKEGLPELMKSWEPTMYEDLKPFVTLIAKKAPIAKTFKDAKQYVNSYLGPNFRCQSIATNDVKICYLVSDNYFVLTTSWTSMTKAIEKLNITLPPQILTKDLRIYMTDSQVSILQTWLARDPTIYSGKTTGYFGAATKAAVIRFQERYASEILAPQNRTTGNGIVDALTRQKLNALYSGAPSP